MRIFKKIVIITFSLSFLFISGCGIKQIKQHKRAVVAPSTYGSFYIGGLFGNSYFIKIRNTDLSYAITNSRNRKKNWVHQSLSKKDILEFEKEMKRLGVTGWKGNYTNPFVRDGTHWLFNYKSRNTYVQAKGVNQYPRNFKKITQYISKVLLKGKKFE